jgi:hypothetical protein
MARLELEVKLTTSDGLVKTTSGDYDFGDTLESNEQAIDQYWAAVGSVAKGSEACERACREQIKAGMVEAKPKKK